MDPDRPLALLAGLTPAAFMHKHWQKEALLIRQAIPAFKPPLSFAGIKALARSDEVQARLIWQDADEWQMEHGPFKRLPTPRDTHWTVLVQGVDLHDDAAAALLHRFRFIPDARLDDMMISIAGDGGGVGPHFDSYDVFLLQAQGQRRWRIGRQKDLSLQPDIPLKVLQHFTPEVEYVLDAGDMLYLPPQIAHDGVAIGECMTISIGFKSPSQVDLACGMLEAAADQIMARSGKAAGPYAAPPLMGPSFTRLYRDPDQTATQTPASIPEPLVAAALAAVGKIGFDDALAQRFLGCWLTEPHASVQFGAPDDDTGDLDLLSNWPASGAMALDRRTRMLYRGRSVYINGELAPAPLSAALRELADRRVLAVDSAIGRRASEAARQCLEAWIAAGWVHYLPTFTAEK
ncbi:MAG: cupin domain-containing protein [Burkholderiaceae bacterium]|nr:cupin domain-containing protein [Burkholderiaceae bacterium]